MSQSDYEANAIGFLYPDAVTRKPDKDAAIEWLRDHGYVRAELEYEGGSDEGGAHSADLFQADGTRDEIRWNEDGFEILNAPIDYKYGSWAGDFRAWGLLVYDVAAGTCVMTDSYEEPKGETTVYEL